MDEGRSYIFEDEYLIAESNGISRELATQRMYKGWSVERAINEKKNEQGVAWRKLWSEWQSTAESNGISKKMFHQRVNYQKLTPEVAATKKTRGRWTKEEREIIENNGLTLNIVNTRISVLGWAKEEAMTTPRVTNEQRGKTISESLKRKHAEQPNKTKWGNR